MLAQITRPAPDATADEIAAHIEAWYLTQGWAQYDGHYTNDQWILVEFVEDIPLRGGIAFTKGERTIVKRHTPSWFPATGGIRTDTAFSFTNRVDTAVYPWSFKEV